MPRLFVNSMANFMIQGGMVGFTLRDQPMRTKGNDLVVGDAEDVADVVMREQDFAKFLEVLNTHAKAFEDQVGRPVGGRSTATTGVTDHSMTQSTPDPQFDGAAMTIRPSES
ncbi:MAG: hypothetical protein AAF557_04900 [Pseudomonadota bacterium]